MNSTTADKNNHQSRTDIKELRPEQPSLETVQVAMVSPPVDGALTYPQGRSALPRRSHLSGGSVPGPEHAQGGEALPRVLFPLLSTAAEGEVQGLFARRSRERPGGREGWWANPS